MNREELKQHLMPFADGELEPELAAKVEAALANDAESREELAELRRISSLSRAAFLAPVEAVSLAGVYDGVMARLGRDEAPGLWARVSKWLAEVVRFERPMVLAGAAALAVALVVGLSLGGGNGAGPANNGATVANSDPKRRGAEEEVKAMGRNTAFVEHLEAQKGKAFVEFDKNDPEAPMVLWHVVDEDGAQAPKGL